MKKSKRITIIFGIILLLAAAALITLGIMKKKGVGAGAGPDFFRLTENDAGQTVSGVAACQPALIGDTDYGILFAMYMEPDSGDDTYGFIGFDVPKSLRADFDFPSSEDMVRIRGLKLDVIGRFLPEKEGQPAVHRDDMLVF